MNKKAKNKAKNHIKGFCNSCRYYTSQGKRFCFCYNITKEENGYCDSFEEKFKQFPECGDEIFYLDHALEIQTLTYEDQEDHKKILKTNNWSFNKEILQNRGLKQKMINLINKTAELINEDWVDNTKNTIYLSVCFNHEKEEFAYSIDREREHITPFYVSVVGFRTEQAAIDCFNKALPGLKKLLPFPGEKSLQETIDEIINNKENKDE